MLFARNEMRNEIDFLQPVIRETGLWDSPSPVQVVAKAFPTTLMAQVMSPVGVAGQRREQ